MGAGVCSFTAVPGDSGEGSPYLSFERNTALVWKTPLESLVPDPRQLQSPIEAYKENAFQGVTPGNALDSVVRLQDRRERSEGGIRVSLGDSRADSQVLGYSQQVPASLA